MLNVLGSAKTPAGTENEKREPMFLGTAPQGDIQAAFAQPARPAVFLVSVYHFLPVPVVCPPIRQTSEERVDISALVAWRRFNVHARGFKAIWEERNEQGIPFPRFLVQAFEQGRNAVVVGQPSWTLRTTDVGEDLAGQRAIHQI